ncbi:hypothetical protein ACH47X_25980 [Promicromonospora kroppenstedtii]|uniref:Ig-like domain-containing protein n=1 Tax=Promicromonospora kroppenstedtii TaxID=440482 RepID=A0ABW7XSV6_9MICO
MYPHVRRLSRAVVSAAALTLLVTPAAAVAAPDGNADGGVPATVTRAETSAIADVPLETSLPTLDSTHPRVGSTLRALAGSWTSGTQFTYQWFASGEAISGATRSTFTPTAAQLGKRLWVRLDGSRDGYLPASRASEPSLGVVSPGSISQGRPVIVGNATPGATLTVARPPAAPAPDSVSYRWRLDGESIRGATRSELTMRSEWRGHDITVSATVEKTGYVAKTVRSAGARVGGAYTRTPRPVISGTKRVGSTLTVTRGTWSPTPSSFSFQWYADGRPISGATTSRYTLKGTDYKKEITVSARSYRAGYGTVLRRSAATNEVLASAVRWEDVGSFLPVGPGGVAPAIYIAQADLPHGCYWERYVSPDTTADWSGSSNGFGQRLFEVLDIDNRVGAMPGCGVWIKYYPGMVRTNDATAAHGVYVLGDHLERGVYSTSGPSVGGESCRYTFYTGFYGSESAEIGGGSVTEATTITMPENAVGFETRYCSWKRIG